jgi:hypothetical protein
MKDDQLAVRAKSKLREFLPASPISTGLIIAIALLILVSLGLTLSHLIQPRSVPAEPLPAETGRPAPSVAPSNPPERQSESPTRRRESYLPYMARVFPTASSSATPKPERSEATPTPPPTDFAAVREQLRAEGKELAMVKIGFHVGQGGNARGLGEYLEALASVGVPAMIKSVDNYGVCAQALQESPDNVVVFRVTGGALELPSYDLPAETAAQQHWARIVEVLPPDFDRRTWLEVMNEPDKGRADWLGEFAYRIAELALRDGYRFAAFGWSSGEPEPEDWQTPGMLAFLTLASQHPERLAVAVHEYSYSVEDIANGYPDLVGRFQTLFRICDQNSIARPTVLVTEWGWEAEQVPPVDQAMEDIAWASELYAAYPEVRGAALWYLGGGYGDIAAQAQKLILPLRYYAWSEYFVIEPGQKPTDPAQFRPD